PDVLDRICNFFDVDARILLEPVGNIPTKGQLLTGPQLHEFFYPSVDSLSESDFPSGIYRFSRRSFLEKSKFVVGLVCVYRRNGFTYVRGYEAKEAILQQGLPADPKSREFRGYVSRQDEGVAMVISRRNAKTCSFNYLSRIASFENNFWVGYVTRTVRESSNATRATRMVYEHLGSSIANIVALARQSGMVDEVDLQPFHKSLLKPDEEFC
ncbi:MAG: XRE family transcriptional regulator, partial [Pseudomonadota bacterium]